MAQIVDSFPAGPTSDKQITDFETYIGHKLPADYRQFLLNHNGGRPEPDAFSLNTGRVEEEDIVMCFFPRRDLKLGDVSVAGIEELRTWPIYCAWDDLKSDMASLYSESGIDDVLLPIGTDGSSNYLCIVVDSCRRETVVFLDHETGGTFLLATSFTSFLGSLRQRQRTDYAIGSEPPDQDRMYDKIGALITSGDCVQCGGTGKCYCIRKGSSNPNRCVRCNNSGECRICQGTGKARR